MITHEYVVRISTPYERHTLSIRAVSPTAAIEMVLEQTSINPQAITKTLVRTLPDSEQELLKGENTR